MCIGAWVCVLNCHMRARVHVHASIACVFMRRVSERAVGNVLLSVLNSRGRTKLRSYLLTCSIYILSVQPPEFLFILY